MSIPDNTTHVYTRQHKTTGLQPNFAGPFPLVERLSRSTTKIKVGHRVSGEPIYEIRHLNDVKLVNPEPEVEDAVRAKRGRQKLPDPPAADALLSVASIDFSKPPPPLQAWVASKTQLDDINSSISKGRNRPKL